MLQLQRLVLVGFLCLLGIVQVNLADDSVSLFNFLLTHILMFLLLKGDDVCKRVQGNIGNKQLLVIGRMRKTLLIVTTDFLVYQIPLTTVNGTLSKLYLGHYKATPIKEAWPKLYNSKQFQGRQVRVVAACYSMEILSLIHSFVHL